MHVFAHFMSLAWQRLGSGASNGRPTRKESHTRDSPQHRCARAGRRGGKLVCVVAARHLDRDQHHRRRRDVVLRGDAARGAIRIRHHRAEASLPYTLAMIGVAAGAILMGWISDRFGILFPALCGATPPRLRLFAGGLHSELWSFARPWACDRPGHLRSFGPLISDISHWFTRRRGIAIAVASCGNYLSGAVWPPILQRFIAATDGAPHT